MSRRAASFGDKPVGVPGCAALDVPRRRHRVDVVMRSFDRLLDLREVGRRRVRLSYRRVEATHPHRRDHIFGLLNTSSGVLPLYARPVLAAMRRRAPRRQGRFHFPLNTAEVSRGAMKPAGVGARAAPPCLSQRMAQTYRCGGALRQAQTRAPGSGRGASPWVKAGLLSVRSGVRTENAPPFASRARIYRGVARSR
jgi:hypothetical protein